MIPDDSKEMIKNIIVHIYMSLMKIFLIVYGLPLLSTQFVFSQTTSRPAVLHHSPMQKTISQNSTFAIRIEDHRLDTVVWWSLDGKYPATSITLSTSRLEELKDFLQLPSLKPSGSSSDSLYVLVRQLRVPNRNIHLLHEKTPVKRRMYYQLRRYLLFGADVFIKRNDGRFQQKLTVNKQYSLNYDSADVAIMKAFNELKLAIDLIDTSRTLLKSQQKDLREITCDTVAFRFLKPDTEMVTKLPGRHDQLKADFEKAWGDGRESGIFQSIIDFKNNTPLPCSIQSVYEDSVYRLAKGSCRQIKAVRLPWAYIDSGKLFVRIFADWYLPVTQQEDYFLEFVLPDSYPDLYALLSIEEMDRQKAASNTGSGNLAAALANAALSALLKDHEQDSRRRKIQQAGVHQPYRQGYIDLEYGDILFRSN